MASAPKRTKIIAGNIIKANMKFWGGSNIPALNGLVGMMLDHESALEKFMGPPSEKSKLKRKFKEVEIAKANVAKCQAKINSLKDNFESISRNILLRVIVIISFDQNAFKNQSVKYKITKNLLIALGISTMSEMQFKNIANNSVVPSQEKTNYNNLLNKLKTVETSILSEMMIMNRHSSVVKRLNFELAQAISGYQNQP